MVRHVQRIEQKEANRNAGGGGVADRSVLGSAEPVKQEPRRRAAFWGASKAESHSLWLAAAERLLAEGLSAEQTVKVLRDVHGLRWTQARGAVKRAIRKTKALESISRA